MPNKSHQKLINDFLKYLEKTKDDDWLLDKCADTPKLEKCCLMAHLYKFGGGDKEKRKANQIFDEFENCVATTYMIFPVNDGKDKNYQQSTAKKRCMSYLRDLRDGKAKTTIELTDESYKIWLKKHEVENDK